MDCPCHQIHDDRALRPFASRTVRLLDPNAYLNGCDRTLSPFVSRTVRLDAHLSVRPSVCARLARSGRVRVCLDWALQRRRSEGGTFCPRSSGNWQLVYAYVYVYRYMYMYMCTDVYVYVYRLLLICILCTCLH